MDIYIAASWRHHVAVDLLADRLRRAGHRVFAFTEAESSEVVDANWHDTPKAYKVWIADMTACQGADLVIYLGPSGVDAWAEVGAAWNNGIPIYGVWSKGEAVGLQRKMVSRWCENVQQLLLFVEVMAAEQNA